jgi:predicted GNAT superfamily acetyltransferase
MTDLRIEPITMQDGATQAALLALNNAHARETSFLTPRRWRTLVDAAFAAVCVDGSAALLVAFDQDADYDSLNFIWFRDRMSRFVYVDRIVVAESHRGGGLASLMYHDLFSRVRTAGQARVVCEVNLVPPNPASDAFHAKMGFTEIGRADLVHGGKTVRYLAKHLAAAAA